MLVVPVGMAVTFWLVLRHPDSGGWTDSGDSVPLLHSDSVDSGDRGPRRMSFLAKVITMRGLVRYMVPLGLDYLFEYLLNQVMMMTSTCSTW